jgi:hypothetical protein
MMHEDSLFKQQVGGEYMMVIQPAERPMCAA